MKIKSLIIAMFLTTYSFSQTSSYSSIGASTNSSLDGSAVVMIRGINIPSGRHVNIFYQLSKYEDPYNYIVNSPTLSDSNYIINNLHSGIYLSVTTIDYLQNSNIYHSDTISIPLIISAPSSTVYDNTVNYSDSLIVDTLTSTINTCYNVYSSANPLKIDRITYLTDSIRVTWKYGSNNDSLKITYPYSKYGVYKLTAAFWCADTTGLGFRSVSPANITFVTNVYLNPNPVISNTITPTPTNINDNIENKIKIYPNPSNGFFSIDNVNNLNIKITDLIGNTLYDNKDKGNKLNITLNDVKGVFFITLYDSNIVMVKKIVIE